MLIREAEAGVISSQSPEGEKFDEVHGNFGPPLQAPAISQRSAERAPDWVDLRIHLAAEQFRGSLRHPRRQLLRLAAVSLAVAIGIPLGSIISALRSGMPSNDLLHQVELSKLSCWYFCRIFGRNIDTRACEAR